MKTLGKKGQLGGLTTMAMSIVILVVVVTAGALILAQFGANTTVAGDTGLNNATYIVSQGKAGLGSLMGWLPLIIIIVIAVLILGFFGLRSQGHGHA